MAATPHPFADPDPSVVAGLVDSLERVASEATPMNDTQAAAYRERHLAAPSRNSSALLRWLARLRPVMANRIDHASGLGPR